MVRDESDYGRHRQNNRVFRHSRPCGDEAEIPCVHFKIPPTLKKGTLHAPDLGAGRLEATLGTIEGFGPGN